MKENLSDHRIVWEIIFCETSIKLFIMRTVLWIIKFRRTWRKHVTKRETFKIYGFIASAVVLAVGTTIGVIVSALKRGLKSVAKGAGDGFKTLGSKISDILPSLIGSITGFISKTAGSVINFLGQNAWPPIMGVTIFMVEHFKESK